MSGVVMECRGFQAGNLLVPSFELGLGSAICLHLPDGHGSTASLVSGLSHPNPAIQLPVRFARWPTHLRRGLLGFFREVRVVDWLCREASIDPSNALAIMARIPLSADSKLARLAGTPRVLLAIEAAYARGTQALIFTTGGLDPQGKDAVFSLVNRNLDRCAALYLSTPFSCNGLWDRSHFPGAKCLDVAPVLTTSHLERTG